MEPAKKIDISELKQARVNLPFTSENVETEKNVKEVIASETKLMEKIEIKKPEEKAYVAHGALSPEQTNNINNLLKRYRRSPYDKYDTTIDYSKAINAMSLTELHTHAIDVQVIPTSDKDKLIKNLENAFGVHINKIAPKIFPPSNLTVKGAAEIEALLASKMPRKS